MKTGIKLRVAFVGAALVLGGVFLVVSGTVAQAQAAPALSAEGEGWNMRSALEGTWRVTVTLTSCQTGAQLIPPFHSLLTFATGGTMTGATSNPAFLPGQRSADHGVWMRTGNSTYSSYGEALIAFTGGRFVAGSQTLTHAIIMADGGNAFTDDAKIQFYDVSGTPLLPISACATATAQRLQ